MNRERPQRDVLQQKPVTIGHHQVGRESIETIDGIGGRGSHSEGVVARQPEGLTITEQGTGLTRKIHPIDLHEQSRRRGDKRCKLAQQGGSILGRIGRDRR